MQGVELAKAYEPGAFEDRVYRAWKDAGAFGPGGDGGAGAYTIVIPPPNVTGVLHLGHALNQALQDIAIRFHRMRGEAALWVPGTDHAGIATQNVVEKRLRAAGTGRRELGRERFVEETWKVKAEHHAVISEQIARMGASVDWNRERFTLDEGLSKAVREVFVTLYERGLLYKGNYLVHWCTSCGTALSDDEVEHSDDQGTMTHIRYRRCDGAGYMEIATTRPETLLGDTALAVHPEDERYRELVGQEVELPLAGRRIPVVADAYVDRAFGTGVVKITPAHDPNDWEVGKRHDLPVINILTAEGRLNDEVPEQYRGLTVKEARKAVLADLEAAGLLAKVEAIKHSVGHCYRCGTVIEPYLSEQWFVKMKPLAEKALAAWKHGDLVFYPRKWENTYEHWLTNIRDWCISRQLWWGHRIPAWQCADCGKTSVSRVDLDACPHCGSRNIAQDEDVLDTWFSSWLWPFSTLGWPEATADYDRHYPTTALVTAYDIIFFWVSRMIMAGLEFTGKSPFRDIYIHGLLRDKKGRKMSKTLGNGIDPLEVVDEYGADALKFTLAFLCAQGQDILIDKESFKLGAKFANKIWNASRYILMNLDGRSLIADAALIEVDTWIYSRLSAAAKRVTEALSAYRYNEAAQTVYEYFWNDFCDWYVEATKLSLHADFPQPDRERDRAVSVLLDVLAESLKLLHPLLPFVTEEIYSYLPNKKGLLITAPYPSGSGERIDAQIEGNFALLQELIVLVRTLRSECTIAHEKQLRVTARCKDEATSALFTKHAVLVKQFAGISRLDIDAGAVGADTAAAHNEAKGAILLAGSAFEALVYVADAVDLPFLKAKFTKETEKDGKYAASLEAKLSNDAFVKNAPPELVAEERKKLEATRDRVRKLSAWVRSMS
ncbi:MAG: valine--tRNA ligase [Spirochaetaceae bacterium]|jgi:valyl-tRNA synthetase|nr:valine--tRNA ligase [Spirochaetaceae bacterium]